MPPEELFTTLIPATEFRDLVARLPLISIDLVVTNQKGEALLGLRTNRPAQGYWFVPGGRVRKDERLEEAFDRLLAAELGPYDSGYEKSFLGVYEHFYDDCFAGEGTSTHYVVLAFRLQLHGEPAQLPAEQHSAYRWVTVDEILNDLQVHPFTRDYFSPGKGIR